MCESMRLFRVPFKHESTMRLTKGTHLSCLYEDCSLTQYGFTPSGILKFARNHLLPLAWGASNDVVHSQDHLGGFRGREEDGLLHPVG